MGVFEYSIIDTVVYEYFTDVVPIRNQQQLSNFLTEYGNYGWELVNSHLLLNNELQVIFKRKKVRV